VVGARWVAIVTKLAPEDAGAATAAAPPLAPETMDERKARWARAVGEHLAGMRFEEEDLEVMPLKILRSLCMQHKVLPSCAVERADFVRALRPCVGGSPAAMPAATTAAASQSNGVSSARLVNGSAVPATANGKSNGTHGEPPRKEPPRKDFSRFLGAAKPNFTQADLEDMPESTLRTLCIQHGVLPPGDSGRNVLRGALAKVALPRRA